MLPLRGTIYPGTWEFVVRGIFEGADDTKITQHLLFHWDYLNETVRKTRAAAREPGRHLHRRVSRIPTTRRPWRAAVDATFRNSLAETLTETEQAFQLGFIAMSNEIIAAIRIVSYVVILIILAVMANTMSMSARERMAEYATLKTLGFGPGYIALLIFGESCRHRADRRRRSAIAATPAAAAAFKQVVGGIFPIFTVSGTTLALQTACAVAVGVVAAIVPAVQAARVRIVEGLRAIG